MKTKNKICSIKCEICDGRGKYFDKKHIEHNCEKCKGKGFYAKRKQQ